MMAGGVWCQWGHATERPEVSCTDLELNAGLRWHLFDDNLRIYGWVASPLSGWAEACEIQSGPEIQNSSTGLRQN